MLNKLRAITVLFCTWGLGAELSAQEGLEPMNVWSIDGNVGFNGAIGSFAPGYMSNALGFGHGDLGVRYMLTPYLGAKLDFGFDRIKNDEFGNLLNVGDFPGAASLEFETHYVRSSLQLYMNIGRMAHLPTLNPKLGAYFHGGLGYSSLKSQKNSVWFQNWSNQGTDEMLHFMFGGTVQYKLASRFALHADITWIANAWSTKTWDFTKNDFNRGAENRLLNLSIGGSYYLGKQKEHVDWMPFAENGPAVGRTKDTLVVQRYDTIVHIDTIYMQGGTYNNSGRILAETNDSDGDGIANAIDKCPEEAGPITNYGCPPVTNSKDKDNDGIRDDIDACPDVFGKIEYQGCPESKAELIRTVEPIGIYFGFDSFSLSEEAKKNCDILVERMKGNNSRVELFGFTDPNGGSNYNYRLAKKRSLAVKKYLVKKGISSERIIPRSAGECEQANKKATNWMCRKVELVLLNN